MTPRTPTTIRFSKAEIAYMQEQAKATGRTLSAYIRDKCVYEPQLNKKL